MGLACLFTRRIQRLGLISLAISAFLVWYYPPSQEREPSLGSLELQQEYPLLWKHVHMFNGTGGGK